jgi:hypothetical protein
LRSSEGGVIPDLCRSCGDALPSHLAQADERAVGDARRTDGTLRYAIADDGTGVDVASAAPGVCKGSGLVSARARATQLRFVIPLEE